jgi:uncharacterized membrane protein
MSKRSFVDPLIHVVLVIVALMLLDQPAQAHKAHESKTTSTSVAEVVVEEQPQAQGASALPATVNPGASVKRPTTVLSWIGRFHPMVVHFPIALFISALVAEILFAATRQNLFRHALRFLLWGGALSAGVAVVLGWIFAAHEPTDHGWLLDAHRWAGTAASALGFIVLLVNELRERAGGTRALLRVSLVAIAVLIGATGFLGGSLLYGIDHLVWSPK